MRHTYCLLRWNDLNCGDVRNFVCKIAKNTTPLPPPTTAPPQGSTSPKCGEDDSWVSLLKKIYNECLVLKGKIR